MKILIFSILTTLTGVTGSIVCHSEQNQRAEAKIQTLSAVVSALSKPPKKAKSDFQKKESEPHQHQYDDMKCSLCGHVLRDGRRIYLDKKVEELEINSKKELDKCNRDLELERNRLAKERRKPKPKTDTVIVEKIKERHDTIVELRGIKKVGKK